MDDGRLCRMPSRVHRRGPFGVAPTVRIGNNPPFEAIHADIGGQSSEDWRCGGRKNSRGEPDPTAKLPGFQYQGVNRYQTVRRQMDTVLLRAPGRSRAPWPKALFALLAVSGLVLAAMHLLTAHTGSFFLSLWFDLDSERAIGPWFSGAQLLATGLLMFVIGVFSDRPFWPSPAFCHVVGLGFVYLSMDEVAAVHERITLLTRSYSWVPRFDGDSGVWIFAYGLIGVALAAGFWQSLSVMWCHHRQPASIVASGFATLVTGAVIVEIAGYYEWFESGAWQVAVEEFLEMLGGTMILAGVVLFFNRTIRLHPAP